MELTGAELIFVKRMLPHFLAGKSVKEAAAAVLEDDNRICNAVFGRTTSRMVQGDNGAFVATSADHSIQSEISAHVYARLKAAA